MCHTPATSACAYMWVKEYLIMSGISRSRNHDTHNVLISRLKLFEISSASYASEKRINKTSKRKNKKITTFNTNHGEVWPR